MIVTLSCLCAPVALLWGDESQWLVRCSAWKRGSRPLLPAILPGLWSQRLQCLLDTGQCVWCLEKEVKVVHFDVHYYCKSEARVPKGNVGLKRIPSSHKWTISFSNLCSEKSNISTSLLETPGLNLELNLMAGQLWPTGPTFGSPDLQEYVSMLGNALNCHLARSWMRRVYLLVFLYLIWCYSHQTSLA